MYLLGVSGNGYTPKMAVWQGKMMIRFKGSVFLDTPIGVHFTQSMFMCMNYFLWSVGAFTLLSSLHTSGTQERWDAGRMVACSRKRKKHQVVGGYGSRCKEHSTDFTSQHSYLGRFRRVKGRVWPWPLRWSRAFVKASCIEQPAMLKNCAPSFRAAV